MSKKKAEKTNWIVRMTRTVTTDVYCDDCTEEQARNDPFEYSTDEVEIDQQDYEVKRVEENS